MVITTQILKNYYTNFSQEIKYKVEKMAKTCIYTQTEWQLQLSDANVLVMFNCYEIAQDSGYQKNASTLPSKMNQKKVS